VLAHLTSYSCSKCGANLTPDEKVCPNCAADLSQVGRKIIVVIEESMCISAEVTAELTQEEKNFLYRFLDWLRENWTLSTIEVGFPSGVKLVFKHREK
jgi:RNA polymerase subunit RPABC4/transcription elongation factor Spt4